MPRSDIRWALDDFKTRQPRYRLFRAYENGDHRFNYHSRKYRTWFAAMVRDLRINLCPTIVNARAERTEIIGWDEGSNATQASQLWANSKMGSRSNSLHRTVYREGDGFILVWPTERGEDRFWPHLPDQMTVRFSEEEPEYPELAAKVWKARDGRGRINLYYPDRVERWTTRKALSGDTGWPMSVAQYDPYTEDRGGPVVAHQYGRVPVVHFPHATDLGTWGKSILWDVIPIQDALNKSAADLLIASEGYAMPLRVFTGVEEKDDQGRPVRIGPDDLGLTFGGTQTKPWQLPAADLEQVLKVRETYQMEGARVTGTPLHYFMMGSGRFPSGEALVVAEARLVSGVEDFEQTATPQWRECMAIAGVEAEPVWKPAAFVTEQGRANNALARQAAGVPWRQTMKELGYSDDQIEKDFIPWLAEQRAMEGSVGDVLTAGFRSGRDPAALIRGEE